MRRAPERLFTVLVALWDPCFSVFCRHLRNTDPIFSHALSITTENSMAVVNKETCKQTLMQTKALTFAITTV
jgi:hypothetical protein